MRSRVEVDAVVMAVAMRIWGMRGITSLTITPIAGITRTTVTRIMVTRIMVTSGMPAAMRRRSPTVTGTSRRDSAAANPDTGKANG